MTPNPDDTPPLPGGFSLQKGEVVVRTGKDWGLDRHALTLTTQRLFCPAEPSDKSNRVAIPLVDVADVVFQKHFVGYSTVTVETVSGRRFLVPAHINGRLIRDDILEMVQAARGDPGPGPHGTGAKAPDRYDQLRKLAELKASGTISETEFEKEKARILRGP